MTTADYLAQFSAEIGTLNAAYVARKATKTAWLTHRNVLDSADLPDDAEIETLAEAMNEASNEYDRLELALRIASEKTIGKGKSLGDFWTAISKMQRGQ